jgi:geranylgeranyl pyrophosphate synthase
MGIAEEFQAFRSEVRGRIDDSLERLLARLADTEVRRAAGYAALSGGQRWRGVLAVAAGRVFDPRAADLALPVACGAELAHAASLVLDDLPSMDNAQVRRGKACVHLVFAPWAVDMVPSYLVTLAYQVSLDNPRVSHERRVSAALELSAAGLRMTHGQAIDLNPAGRDHSPARLLECYRLKTGMLSAAAAKAGAITCGAAAAEAEALEGFGTNLGVAYQILDDLADATASLEEMGKCRGMDAAKVTAVDLFGVDGTRQKAQEFKDMAVAQLDRFGAEAALLQELAGRTGWEAAC